MSDPVSGGIITTATASPPILPGKEELEREQAYLANQKTRIEIRKLEQEAKPERWWLKLAKNVVAVGGILTVAATGYGIWDSYNKTIDDREKARIDRERTRAAEQRVRFEDAIKRLESASTISKLVGVSVLSGYLTPTNKALHQQIFFTLAGLMSTEKDFQTQTAVIDLVAAAPNDGAIASEDWQYFQQTLISQNRALMEKGELADRRHVFPTSDEERAARTLAKLIALIARKGVVPGHKNYRRIYCVDCDFRGVRFPPEADFTAAVLDGANFGGAILPSAIFDNAELIRTKFVEADLRNAKFRSFDEAGVMNAEAKADRVPFGRTMYLDRFAAGLDANAVIEIYMPNFSCANLEEANFDRHALFPAYFNTPRVYNKGGKASPKWLTNLPSYLKDDLEKESKINFSATSFYPPKFLKSNIRNTKLDLTRFFSLFATNEKLFMNYSQSLTIAGFTSAQGTLRGDHFDAQKKDAKGASSNQDADFFQQRMRASFYLSNFTSALLPDDLRKLLDRTAASERDYRVTYSAHGFLAMIFPQELDPDLHCTPRSN